MRLEDLDFDDIRELIHKNKDLNYGLFHEFLDYFHQIGGFDALRKALKCVVPHEGQDTLPLEIIPVMTSPFKNCQTIINPEYIKEMTEELQSIVIDRLNNMTDEEMKDVDKATISSLLNELREFLCMGLDENSVDEKLESVRLAMALRFLKSTNMKKRLTGINDIKSIIEMTSDSIRRNQWHDDDSPRRARWLKPEYLCKWIHDNQLPEYLLGDSSHVEVIRRSTTVLKFLSHYKQLTKEHLDLLWKCQEDKHEAVVLGVYEVINELALDLDKESLDFIFEKINSIPQKKYNEQTINFVKEFTCNACRVARTVNVEHLVDLSSDNEEEEKKSNEEYIQNAAGILSGEVEPPKPTSSEYGLPILFELSKLNTELGKHSLECFKEILKYKFFDVFRMPYMLSCIKHLQEGNYVYQSLTLLLSILPKCFQGRRQEISSPLTDAVLKLHEQFDLINLAIKNIEKYNEVVQKSMVDSINKGVIPDNISKSCFEGIVTHSDYLEKLLEFIESVSSFTLGEVRIGNENIQKLWNIFVNISGIEFDKNLFFKWLNKEKFVHNPNQFQLQNLRRIFSSEERHFLFNEIFCKPEYVNKKEITYNCFK